MDTIYLHDQREAFIPCSLTDRSENYRSMSLWEIDQIRQLDRSIIANHEPKKIIGKVNLARAVKEKVDEAVAMKKQQPEPSASKRSKTSNIRTNRAQEKESLRSRDAFHQKPQRQPQATRVLAIEGAQVENDEFDLSEVTPSLLNFRRENPVDKS